MAPLPAHLHKVLHRRLVRPLLALRLRVAERARQPVGVAWVMVRGQRGRRPTRGLGLFERDAVCAPELGELAGLSEAAEAWEGKGRGQGLCVCALWSSGGLGTC